MAARKMESSELVFKIIAYTLLTIFSLFCLYPFIYMISASISGKEAFMSGKIVIIPMDIQFKAFADVLYSGEYATGFWVSYANTLFVTFYGTVWSLFTSIMGAYTLSKKRTFFRSGFNFFIVFTMWFTAGMVPQLLNYQSTQKILGSIGITDDKWLVVLAMGMAGFNVILLRNAFEGIPKEIEEAATVDGANEFQLLWKVYFPMSKATIATVALLFGISRWNGYFWARATMKKEIEFPLQVYIRKIIWEKSSEGFVESEHYATDSLIYAMLVCAVVPIMVVYPYIQKFFAKGVNVGGVKE